MSSKQEALGRLAEAFEKLPFGLAMKVSLKPGNLGEEDLPALLPNERLLSFPVAIPARFLGLQEQGYVEVSALIVLKADEGFGVLAPKAAFAATGQGKTETWLSLLIQASLAAPAPPLRPEQGVCVQAGPNSFVDLSLIEDFRERKLPPPLLASLEQKIKAIPAPWVLHFEITALGLASAELCRQLAAPASAPQEAAQASAAPAASPPETQAASEVEFKEKEVLFSNLLRIYAGKVSDQKFQTMLKVLASDRSTAGEKLEKIDSILPIPPAASAEALGQLLGVTAAAVIQTPWWKKNRKGKKDEETVGRLNRLRKKGEYHTHEDFRPSEDDED